MKSLLTLLSLFLFVGLMHAQPKSYKLKTEQFEFTIAETGAFFLQEDQPLGLVDKYGRNLLFAHNVMYYGLDSQGEVKGASEFFNAAYNLGTINSDPNKAVKALNMVSAVQISAHRDSLGISGYTTPNGILNWPGSGDTSIGELANMAPYVDVNQNNTYDPLNGDYPLIIGDIAIYSIKNDQGLYPGAGMELHQTVYLFTEGSQVLQNSILMATKMYNRSTEDYSNFRVGVFSDFDFGDPRDDYFGSSEEHNAMFAYNGDANDQQFAKDFPGFVFGSILCGLQGAGYFGFSGQFSEDEFYKSLNHRWFNGSCWMDLDSNLTRFMFHGPIEAPNAYNELFYNNSGGDRRGLAIFIPQDFMAGESRTFLSAYTHKENPTSRPQKTVLAETLQQLESIENYLLQNHSSHPYLSEVSNCGEIQEPDCQTTSITELDANDFVLYPNPSKGLIRVVTHYPLDTYEVYDSSGKLQKAGSFSANTNLDIDLRSLDAGLYYIRLFGRDGKSVSKAISLN